MSEPGGIHDEHPFVAPVADRDPARRVRGRLAAPVTVFTAGDDEHRSGLTISSLVIAEGEPSRVYFLIGSATDLWFEIERTGKFVVHICESHHRELSDVFAGLRPAPGGPFAGRELEASEWGPVLAEVPNRIYCTFDGGDEETYSVLAEGVIDKIELTDLDDPLAYFRGEYRRLG